MLKMNELYNMDCMEGMRQFPDKYFELAIVDPPYGIGANKMQLGNGKRKIYRGKDDWDKQPPSEEYFKELFRVSKNQIVWGANHFISRMPLDSRCWIFWDKGTGDNDFADGELAWTSFKSPVRKYFKSWVGANAKEKQEHDRIHPTQKPIALYKWLLKNYANEGDKILDTHVGSASSLIACHDYGFEYIGFEIDPDYYKAAKERLEAVKSQLTMF
jgi:site-specific DNA-methyltransferase (adenine-specific)